MTDKVPMSDERLAEIKRVYDHAAYRPIIHELLAEVERPRAERIQAGELRPWQVCLVCFQYKGHTSHTNKELTNYHEFNPPAEPPAAPREAIMGATTPPMSEREWLTNHHADCDELDCPCNLLIDQYDDDVAVPLLCGLMADFAAHRAAALERENARLREIEQRFDDQLYCEACGSCGIADCCSPEQCKKFRCEHGESLEHSYKEVSDDWDAAETRAEAAEQRITRLLGLLRECEKVEPDALGRGLLRRITEEVGK